MNRAKVYRLARGLPKNRNTLATIHKRQERLLWKHRRQGFINWFGHCTNKYEVLGMDWQRSQFFVRVRKNDRLLWVSFYDVMVYG